MKQSPVETANLLPSRCFSERMLDRTLVYRAQASFDLLILFVCCFAFINDTGLGETTQMLLTDDSEFVKKA